MSKILEPSSELDGGKYKIVRLLGEGGMGTVFEAEQRETQKRVAIKCMHPHQAGDPDIAERLLREARAMARVRHPNVVDFYDVGRDGTTIYLVMEYLEGETLARAIARNDLPPYLALSLLIAAMRGVAAAHAQGIIHRDIKPDNIFLARIADAPGPVPKVLDFGISKVAWKTAKARVLTRSGVAIGTPSYMSYEQLAGEHDIDQRADVYAFGVILYEILTGRVPYEADTFPELLLRFSTRAPLPPKQLRPELPGTLDRIVMWALEKERKDRIASLEALIRELEPFATRRGFEAEQTRSEPTFLPRALEVEAPDSVAEQRQVSTYAGSTLPGKRSHQGLIWLLVAAAIALAVLYFTGFSPQPATQRSTSAATRAPQAHPAPVPPPTNMEIPASVLENSPSDDAPTQVAAPLPQGRMPPGAAAPATTVEPASAPSHTQPRAAPAKPPAQARPIGPRPRDLGIY